MSASIMPIRQAEAGQRRGPGWSPWSTCRRRPCRWPPRRWTSDPGHQGLGRAGAAAPAGRRPADRARRPAVLGRAWADCGAAPAGLVGEPSARRSPRARPPGSLSTASSACLAQEAPFRRRAPGRPRWRSRRCRPSPPRRRPCRARNDILPLLGVATAFKRLDTSCSETPAIPAILDNSPSLPNNCPVTRR